MALKEVAGGAGGLAAANPYGAAIGAAAGVLNSALADTPTSVGGGAVNYQAGPFTVGSRQVGGTGNSAGATTASASQTPTTGAAASPVALAHWQFYLAVAGVVLAAAALFFSMHAHRRGR